MFSIAMLTRHVGHLRLQNKIRAAPLANSLCRLSNSTNLLFNRNKPATDVGFVPTQIRTFAKKGNDPRILNEKNARRLKIQAKKKKNSQTKPAGEDISAEKPSVQEPFLQHQEWVKFQQSIAVDGFETGQIKQAKVLSQKTRGGARMRRQKERELGLTQGPSSSQQQQQFPVMRLSPEETQKWLEHAYSQLPARGGKRRTRHLKRQKRRWFLVRKIRAKQKYFKILEHERKMAKRHEKRQQVIAMKSNAIQMRQSQSEHQEQVLRKWAELQISTSAKKQIPAGTEQKLIDLDG